MKFSIVTAIRYLCDHTLAPEEVIVLDCWDHEGYDMLIELRNVMEGPVEWDGSSLDSIENDQIGCLVELVYAQNLCFQFVGTYPCVDGDNNLQVFITSRKIAQETLGVLGGYEAPTFPRKAIANPLQGTNSVTSEAGAGRKNGKSARQAKITRA